MSNPPSKPNSEVDAETARKYNLRSVRRVSLRELAAESDIMFVLVKEDFLRKMKETAALVNTARGTLVDSGRRLGRRPAYWKRYDGNASGHDDYRCEEPPWIALDEPICRFY